MNNPPLTWGGISDFLGPGFVEVTRDLRLESLPKLAQGVAALFNPEFAQ
jgi:hypothetical protein